MALFLWAGTTGESPCQQDGPSLAKIRSCVLESLDCSAARLDPPIAATARRRRVRRWHLRASPEESACPLPCRKRTPSGGPEHFGRAEKFAKRLRPLR